MSTAPADRVASGILAIEAIALVIVAGWEIVALVSGDAEDVGSSIALIVLTVIAAAAVLAFGVAALRSRSWGRSGGIVTQLLVLAVAIGAVTGPSPSPVFAATLAVPAIAALIALVLGVRRAGAQRAADEAAASEG